MYSVYIIVKYITEITMHIHVHVSMVVVYLTQFYNAS